MRDWLRQRRLLVRLMMLAGVFVAGMPHVFGAEPAADEAARKSAAVALNYSRAAFHRIRRQPSVRVLWEEQEKILNHLNLNGIADEDVVKLYTSVLDEIAQVQLTEREQELMQERYRRQFQQTLGINALSLGTQIVTAQYASAVRTGCNSWWDFRLLAQNREIDQFRVEKDRMTKLVEKSAKFLDVSWKMARDRHIPDRWLVRGDDLDKLEEACRETDPNVRLRILKRMESYLECYPPYWYYTARTYQSTGQLILASETYDRLEKLGEGHFRKDEMLAAGLANRALIQAYLKQPEAIETAQRALTHSTDVWEANLICASVLMREGRYHDAEDAILRNLDVSLERTQSQLALVALHFRADDRTRLAGWLSDPTVVRDMPASMLVQCAARLGDTGTPAAVTQLLQRSLQAQPRYNLGRDDLVVQAGPLWNLTKARLTLQYGDQTLTQPKITVQKDGMTATFEGIAEWGTSFASHGDHKDLVLQIAYNDAAPVQVTLQLAGVEPQPTDSPLTLSTRRTPVYRVSAVAQDTVQLSWQGNTFHALDTALPTVPDRRTETLPAGQTTTLKPPVDDTPLVTPPIDVPVTPPSK